MVWVGSKVGIGVGGGGEGVRVGVAEGKGEGDGEMPATVGVTVVISIKGVLDCSTIGVRVGKIGCGVNVNDG